MYIYAILTRSLVAIEAWALYAVAFGATIRMLSTSKYIYIYIYIYIHIYIYMYTYK